MCRSVFIYVSCTRRKIYVESVISIHFAEWYRLASLSSRISSEEKINVSSLWEACWSHLIHAWSERHSLTLTSPVHPTSFSLSLQSSQADPAVLPLPRGWVVHFVLRQQGDGVNWRVLLQHTCDGRRWSASQSCVNMQNSSLWRLRRWGKPVAHLRGRHLFRATTSTPEARSRDSATPKWSDISSSTRKKKRCPECVWHTESWNKGRVLDFLHDPDRDPISGSLDWVYGTPTWTPRPVSRLFHHPRSKRKAQYKHQRTSLVLTNCLKRFLTSQIVDWWQTLFLAQNSSKFLDVLLRLPFS